MKKTTTSILFAAMLAAAIFSSPRAFATGITSGDLVVTRFGDGSGALASSATATFVDEYTTSGTPVQTIAMPTASGGGNNILTNSGTSTSEGFIVLSANGQYLTLAGYNTATGTASITTSATIARTAGRITVSSGAVDTSTLLAAASADGNTGNPRSIVSNDGSQFWVATSAGGVRYQTFGSTGGSTQVLSTPANTRVDNIFNGQLYLSSASGTALGPGTVGSGLPTTSGQTYTELSGFPSAGTHSNYDYWFKDANTLYVADDGAVAAGGGIQKWTLSGGTWSLAYTLLNNGTTTTGVRGLAGTTDGSGNAVLFATTTATSANTIITVTDTGAASASSLVATAAANEVFRGVEFIPVPEPSTLVLGSLCLVGLASFARRRKTA